MICRYRDVIVAPFALFAFTAPFAPLATAAAADWPLFDHDAARSGVADGQHISPKEAGSLRVRWQTKLGDVADSAPVVADNRVYETTRDGTTYALDTADGHIVWRFATHGPKITTSVPAFDAGTKTLYAGGVDGAVHALDPATGRELHERGFPATITLAAETEKDASPLNVANGYLYAQTSGYIGDATPYVGHIVAIRLRDGDEHVFNSLCGAQHALLAPRTCGGQRSGMWSRAGIVVDPDPDMHGRIYAATGNGPFDPSAGDYGDAILSLDADASRLLGYIAPYDYAALEAGDLDVGSSSPALLPRQAESATPLMAVQGGKDSKLRLFDRTHLDGIGATMQTLDLGSELFSAPAVWTEHDGTTLVILGLADGVRAYKLTTQNRKSRLDSAWHSALTLGREGSSAVVADGVVFVATSGELVALDAETGERLGGSNALGPIHWQSPSIASGTVYCSDSNGELTAFSAGASSK
jgi:outer membrane protein assembly factor BamB